MTSAHQAGNSLQLGVAALIIKCADYYAAGHLWASGQSVAVNKPCRLLATPVKLALELLS